MRVFDITLYLLFSSPGAPDSCRENCEVDLVDASIRLGAAAPISFLLLSCPPLL